MALVDNKSKIQALLAGINALPEAGSGEPAEPVLQEKTVSPSTSAQSVTPDSGYDGLSKVTVNAMPTATQATPSISVSSAGLITASATQSAGYVAAGTKSATKQLTVQAAQTITPGTSDKTIASGRYLTGTQTIKGDSNLVAGNIKSGVSIFGVAGGYEGSGGGGASLETCTVTVEGCRAVYYTGVENGAIVAKSSTGTSNSATHNIVVCKNSMVFCGLIVGANIIVTGGRLLASYLTYYCACEVTSDNASITATTSGGTSGGSG